MTLSEALARAETARQRGACDAAGVALIVLADRIAQLETLLGKTGAARTARERALAHKKP